MTEKIYKKYTQFEPADSGLGKEEISQLETKIKSRYEFADFSDGDDVGYKITDKKNNSEIYFSANCRAVLENRYLEKNVKREVMENVLDLFARVSVNLATADKKYDNSANLEETADRFLEMMLHKDFMPNTPTLCNAGRALQQLSACFVLPIEDYMATDDIGEDPEKQGDGIYDSLRNASMIHKSGGGQGFNFSHLRPRSDRISTTFGSSSGPVSFIKSYDAATDAVNQGGFRRGANMAILNYDHPDIFEFIHEKTKEKTLTNFNLSVGVDDDFIKLVKDDGYYKMASPKNENKLPREKRVWTANNVLDKSHRNYKELVMELEPSLITENKKVINLYDGKEVGKVNDDGELMISARALFDYVASCAWKTGCPGVIFLDRLEKNNKTPKDRKSTRLNSSH